jgi:GcrA cell cycle regulator
MTEEWNPERTAALITLWNEGICASEIGRRLAVTKNAVIGKAFRLQLRKRRQPPAAPSQEQSVVRLERLSTGMCSWPLGEADRGGFHFCAAPTVPGKPYCATHCRLAYVPANRSRKVPAAV